MNDYPPMKTCYSCDKSQPLSCFHKKLGNKDGLDNRCKQCRKSISIEYYNKNFEKIQIRQSFYYKLNKEMVAKRHSIYAKNNPDKVKSYQEKWRDKNREKERERASLDRINNPDKARARTAEWRLKYPEKSKVSWTKSNYKKRQNPKFRLSSNMSRRIRETIKSKTKMGRHWEELVGYTTDQLINRLKKTIPKGYSWKDFLSGKLHVDHIIPVAVFNFETPEDLDFKRCWCLKNLQLLPAKENLVKNAKFKKPFQPSLLLKACD